MGCLFNDEIIYHLYYSNGLVLIAPVPKRRDAWLLNVSLGSKFNEAKNVLLYS